MEHEISYVLGPIRYEDYFSKEGPNHKGQKWGHHFCNFVKLGRVKILKSLKKRGKKPITGKGGGKNFHVVKRSGSSITEGKS